MSSTAEATTPTMSTARRRPAAPAVGYAGRLLAAVVTAFCVTAAGYIATIVLLFAANGASAAALASLGAYFALGALVTAIVLFIAAAFGLFARWYGALLAGLVGTPIGVLLGLLLVLSGAKFTGSLWLQMLGSLLSVNFLLWFTVTAAAPLLGPIVWAATVRGRRRSGPVLLVRLPAAGEGAGGAADADEQWDGLVHTLTGLGADAVEVPVAEHSADSVFVGDIVVVLGAAAIPAAGGGRQAEVGDLRLRLRERSAAIEELDEPEDLFGADVLVAGRDVYVAAGGATSAAGIRELREIAAVRGYGVVALEGVTGRLADAATALPDGTVLGDPERLGQAAELVRALRPAPEPAGASVLVVDEQTVLVSAAAPQTQAMLERLGFATVSVDVSAFESRGGGLGRLAARLG
ncbi:MAG TPA: hypothetical protein VFQ96_02215 [Microbacteriaceae bacterium]|nr:hypothetical protein [Microbacteriaceae bacterium]